MKADWKGSTYSAIFVLSLLDRTLKMILSMSLIRLIGLKPPAHLAPAILGTSAI